nr:YetF domain-containing protein [uncultured Psychroserpens sp.]
MKEWFTSSTESLMAILLTAIGIYFALVVLTRISGKRSFSKLSSFDFAMTVAIGSVMATVMVSKSVSLLDGIVGLIAIYAIQMIVAFARRMKPIQQLMDNKPTLLMKDGEVIEGSLEKCKVTASDLKAKLREANVIQLSEVKAVVFESTGDISVLHGSDDKEIDDWIMDF